MPATQRRIVILGAAGRDFHDFNVRYRQDESVRVVAFTAAQIPDIAGRGYPPELAGPLYPEGIPIILEDDFEDFVRREAVDACVFAYSDVSHDHVMKLASRATAAGADFELLGPRSTQLESSKPVFGVVAVRTGCGKSPATRRIAEHFRDRGVTVAAVRHPMPYGDLRRQAVQRFGCLDDLAEHDCTIEEMEEYEHLIDAGLLVFAGADYEGVLRAAEKEADVVLWDGGNNDFSFFRCDETLCILDPHRAGHELGYWPGMVNFLTAGTLLVNKLDSASEEKVAELDATIRRYRPDARVVRADCELAVADPGLIAGKRVLCIEDGPTLTHGGMQLGAATLAAERCGAAEVVDPRPWLTGKLAETFETYPDIGPLLPAMGYSDEQIADLQAVIQAAEVDALVVGTPIDLARLVDLGKPSTRVRYSIAERGEPTLARIVDEFLERKLPR
jgi:predicted GTPase